MKLSIAFQCAFGATTALLVSPSLALRIGAKPSERTLQQTQEPILSYTPLTQVTDAAAIDLDQVALESMAALSTVESLNRALAIYSSGASSKSYAVLTLDPALNATSALAFKQGTFVSGTSFDGEGEVRGTLLVPVEPGATEMLVQYETQDQQELYSNCRVGASPDPAFDGCKSAAIQSGSFYFVHCRVV